MYCPHCGTEYRERQTECPECGATLIAGTASFDPSLGLVEVLETNDRILAAMAKGLLEEEGIPFYVLGQITTLIQDVDPFLHKWVRLQVPRDREAEAREILAPLVKPVPIEDERP